MKPILISDAKCHDCSGPVTLFAVPDKVWLGLGLTTEWVCTGCIARRLNPNINTEELSDELRKQNRRFNLKQFNKFCGVTMPIPRLRLLIADAGAEGHSTITMEETMFGERKVEFHKIK
jgi:hypothetical protein